MGLALVKRVVEAHGATIDVETATGVGHADVAALAGASRDARRTRPRSDPVPLLAAGTMRVVALGGALAVPCTRNPL